MLATFFSKKERFSCRKRVLNEQLPILYFILKYYAILMYLKLKNISIFAEIIKNIK